MLFGEDLGRPCACSALWLLVSAADDDAPVRRSAFWQMPMRVEHLGRGPGAARQRAATSRTRRRCQPCRRRRRRSCSPGCRSSRGFGAQTKPPSLVEPPAVAAEVPPQVHPPPLPLPLPAAAAAPAPAPATPAAAPRVSEAAGGRQSRASQGRRECKERDHEDSAHRRTSASRSAPGCGTPASRTIARSKTATTCGWKGATQLFQGTIQLIATAIRQAPDGEVDLDDFLILGLEGDRAAAGATGRLSPQDGEPATAEPGRVLLDRRGFHAQAGPPHPA